MGNVMEEKLQRVGVEKQHSARENARQEIINRWIHSLEALKDVDLISRKSIYPVNR